VKHAECQYDEGMTREMTRLYLGEKERSRDIKGEGSKTAIYSSVHREL